MLREPSFYFLKFTLCLRVFVIFVCTRMCLCAYSRTCISLCVESWSRNAKRAWYFFLIYFAFTGICGVCVHSHTCIRLCTGACRGQVSDFLDLELEAS